MDSSAAKIELRAVDDQDKISQMPEGILGHIVSFLDTKEAVRTSVLSKKWRHIWTLSSKIRLDQGLLNAQLALDNEEKVDFANVVDRVLRRHVNSRMRSFILRVSSYSKYDPSQVDAWISSIVRKHIQYLHIEYIGGVFSTSCPLFEGSTLVNMVLETDCTVTVPAKICLPKLESLRICGIKFVNDSSNHSEDITFSFPLLKAFDAGECAWLTMKNVIIQAPQLERFCMVSLNTRRKSYAACTSTIKICTSSLERFTLYGDLILHDYILSDSSSLNNCWADISILEDTQFIAEPVTLKTCYFLQQFRGVQHMRLGLDTMKILAEEKIHFRIVPVFALLIELQLENFDAETMLALLHNSPLLDTLVLHTVTLPLDEDLLISATVPQCLLSTLKVIRVIEFRAEEHELFFIKYILVQAQVLEKMTITPSWLLTSDIQMAAKAQILSFADSSSIKASVEFTN